MMSLANKLDQHEMKLFLISYYIILVG